MLGYVTAGEEGPYQIFVRPLDQPESRSLPGTQGSYVPVFSPDAQWIAYYNNDERVLKKISIHGGPPITLCEGVWIEGMTWTTDGYIIYCQRGTKEVYRVRENGSEPETLVSFDDQADPFDAHRPHALPDASAILFSGYAGLSGYGDPSIKAFSFATGQTIDLVRNASAPLYSQSGLKRHNPRRVSQ